ncbi:hypothetical protein M9H77_33694 [Catharanthus roseus]|uniref:Uncharacterized protein n=1 Tax=Catharanthus roseus TaxID=4058 RepID=A0ACB9ZJ69_CATRO|nr:hypothetical protein M9H77_33694 [Catharanthus roseus]
MEVFMSSLGDMLFKVGLFVLVQGLVYLILSQSSNVFSKTTRSFSFKTARSVSIRRMAAMLADIPAGGEMSPSAASTPNKDGRRFFTRNKSSVQDFDSST